MLQAQFVDLDVYFRTGGVNWPLTKANQDAVAIQAGIGTWANPLLREQVEGAVANGMPYFTWWIPDISDGPISNQVNFLLGLYGVRGHWVALDIEKPSSVTRCVNATEALGFAHALEDATGEQPLMYSNKKCITEDLKSPSWLIDYYWWLAQYLYHYLILQYKNYAEFLEDHANQLPPSAAQLGLESKTIGWQFSRKGDAWNLCANQQTLDPLNPVGIKECDPSVSTVEKLVFLSMLGDPTPPPPPVAVAGFEVVADVVNIRLGPGTNYDTDGQLTKGAVGDVFATDGADVWYKIGANHWIASYVAGKRYSKLI